MRKIPSKEELQREEEEEEDEVGHLSSLLVSTFLFCFVCFYLPSLQLRSSPSSLLTSFLPCHRRMGALMRFGSRWLAAMHPTTTTATAAANPPVPAPTLFPLNDGAADDILLTRRH